MENTEKKIVLWNNHK